jgi:hypothetical protein
VPQKTHVPCAVGAGLLPAGFSDEWRAHCPEHTPKPEDQTRPSLSRAAARPAEPPPASASAAHTWTPDADRALLSAHGSVRAAALVPAGVCVRCTGASALRDRIV